MQRQPDKIIAVVAIKPVDRQAWLLENLRRQLFAGFLLLHIVGAHYTYGGMPLGRWAQEQFSRSGNHYGRVVRFAFGLLLAFRLRELLLRVRGITRGWSFLAAIVVIVSASGIFEMIEALVAEIVAPGAGVQWLGAQGDEWDAQNDILMALLGAVAIMVAVALVERSRRRRT